MASCDQVGGCPAPYKATGNRRCTGHVFSKLSPPLRIANVAYKELNACERGSKSVAQNERAQKQKSPLAVVTGSGLCSLPHVGMQVDREGTVIPFARCSAKKYWTVQEASGNPHF